MLCDGLDSTLALAHSSGEVQTEYSYEGFGGTTSTGQANSNSSQYTGRENDGTSLYYYRARYYSPTLQRFISEDPIGFGGGDTNLYAYVFNDPTNLTDPSGLSVWRTVYRVFTQVGKPVGQISEISKRKVVDRVAKALDKAGDGGIIQAENEAARDAIAKALSPDGKMRGPEKSYGYPEGVHPNSGPHTDKHIQTAPPGRERLAMFLAPMSMTLSGRKDVTNGQFASAVAWDIASAIDPLFITDGLDWYFDLSCQ